jgi:hypothetical protein
MTIARYLSLNASSRAAPPSGPIFAGTFASNHSLSFLFSQW